MLFSKLANILFSNMIKKKKKKKVDEHFSQVYAILITSQLSIDLLNLICFDAKNQFNRFFKFGLFGAGSIARWLSWLNFSNSVKLSFCTKTPQRIMEVIELRGLSYFLSGCSVTLPLL